MTPGQCRAARKRLGWSIEELAHRSCRSHTVIGEFERARKPANDLTIASLRRAFAEAGVDVDAIQELAKA